MSLPANAALIVIDVQTGFDDPRWGRRNNPQAEQTIAQLLAAWRQTKRPIVHIQHLSQEPNSPLRPDRPGCAIKDSVKPLDHEPVIQKHVNSAFIGTNLETRLRDNNCTTLVIVGLTTNHCVSTTARMAGNLGFTTYVVEDATATFDRTGHDGQHYDAETIHAISLANLHQEFAIVIDSKTLLKQVIPDLQE
jgi:nicotinamidase-related amidase